MQAQTSGRLKAYRVHLVSLGLVAGLGLLAATIFGIQALSGGQQSLQTQELAPVSLLQEDPPLPEGWTDPYFSSEEVVIPVETDPPLPDGWADPYFKRVPAMPELEDPPLPEGWVDPYFKDAD
jgi:hypothetical protein